MDRQHGESSYVKQLSPPSSSHSVARAILPNTVVEFRYPVGRRPTKNGQPFKILQSMREMHWLRPGPTRGDFGGDDDSSGDDDDAESAFRKYFERVNDERASPQYLVDQVRLASIMRMALDRQYVAA